MVLKSETESAYFQPGSAVAVSLDDDRFRGSWFSGTVVSCITSDVFMVEFRNFIVHAHSDKKLLRELFGLHQLRPLPMPETQGEFKSGDKVVFPKHSAHREWTHNWAPPVSDRDRISELHDSVLLHMMSFMDTKDAVRTCVLSKRWKDLCKCLTSLTFNFPIYPAFPVEPAVENFEKFTTWVLSIRDDSYSLVNLTIDSWIEAEVLDRVIQYALFHNLQLLTICLIPRFRPNFDFESLPRIFCSGSLTSLKLCFGLNTWKITLPESLQMPALKSLHLRGLYLTPTNNDYVEPLSNCHVLDDLYLAYCHLHNDAQVFCISNPTLSSLTMEQDHKAYKTVLSTPNLRSCTIKNYSNPQLSTACNLSFLRDVNIGIFWGTGSTVVRWLQVFANVKTLTLSSAPLRMILRDLLNPGPLRPESPRFVRLETLKVETEELFTNEEVNIVVEYLLQNSPMARVDVHA